MQHRTQTYEQLLAELDRVTRRDADFHAVFRASPDLLLLLTPDFTMVEVSDARLKATATTREETLGRNLFDVFPDSIDNEAAGQVNLRTSLTRVLETKQPHEMALQRYDLLRPDGTSEERHWRPLNVPVLGPDGEVQFILHRVEDATAEVRLAASEAKRERERELNQRIIDNAPAGISLLNQDLVYEWVNPTQSEFAGIPVEQMVGRSLFEVFGPETEAQVGAMLREVLATGVPYRATNLPFTITREGHERATHWDITYQPVRDEAHRNVGILILSLEVSDRVEKDRERQRFQAERAVMQAERITALEQANRHKEQFLGILSHELRTPINAIMGFGSVLADGLAGELPPEQFKYIGKILDSADALLGLVNDLLDMSRVQAGKFALDLRAVEVAPLIRNSLADLAAEAMRKGHSLVNEVPTELPTIQADPQRFRQVLDNLVTNAIKYTPEGGTITVRARVDGTGLRVEVADTGLGVSPGQQARIFQAFTQVDMTSTRAKGGVGLGLSIVKALIEAHGGAVGVESEGEGRGSTFFFTLPLRAG